MLSSVAGIIDHQTARINLLETKAGMSESKKKNRNQRKAPYLATPFVFFTNGKAKNVNRKKDAHERYIEIGITLTENKLLPNKRSNPLLVKEATACMNVFALD